MKLIVTLYILAVAINCSAVQIEKESTSNNRKVINALNRLAGVTDPGIQYVVVNKDSVIFNRNVGLSKIEENILLDSNDTMAAFSMTKILTAIAILQLVERNKISLDDKASDYIEHPYNPEISIRHLLSHTSGIPNPIPLKWVHLAKSHANFDERAALIKVLQENPDLNSSPGEKYSYSNIGYWLLGKIIEKVSGKTYSDYVSKNIFEAVGLTSKEVSFLIEDENNHAKGYLKKWSLMNFFGRFFIDKDVLGEYERGWLHIKSVYLNGPSFGGAIGSATAFSRILQDLLSEQSKLIKGKTKQLLYSQQKTKSGKKIDMTLGWHIDKLNGATYYYKEGGGAGFHCEMRIYPDSGLASVVMTNRTSFDSRKILTELDMNFVTN
ncbi:MAG: serine hydrolase domain-containing protein [Gammaproteobacteria bacterium]|nr:serine hydrolase domain-containing protein [Gammaproteobacteria bacterium]